MLKIVDLKGNHLASIYRENSGKLSLKIIDKNLEEEITSFFDKLESEPVYLVGGTLEMEDKTKVYRTQRRQVRPEDDDFFMGVTDMITRSRITLGGLRVRGLVVSDQEVDNG